MWLYILYIYQYTISKLPTMLPANSGRFCVGNIKQDELWANAHLWIPPHICSICIKTNQVGKQEVGIWRVQKRFPRYGFIYMKLVTKYQISSSNSCWEKYLGIDGRRQTEGRTGVKQYTTLRWSGGITRKSLKIPKWYSEAVIRRTDNTMPKRIGQKDKQ